MKKISIILFLVIILFTACEQAEHSVFWAVANAVPEVDNSLNNFLTVVSMVDDGSNFYLAAGNQIYYRVVSATGGEPWSTVILPPSVEVVTAMEFFGTSLYASFLFHNGSHGFYYNSTPTQPTNTWLAAGGGTFTGKQIVRLKVSGGSMAVSFCDYNGTNNQLYFTNDGTSFFDSTIPAETHPITDVTNAGAVFWAITRYKIFSGANNSMSEYSNAQLAGQSYGGIFYSTGTYYVSNQSGVVYSSLDTGTWTASAQKVINQKAVCFTEFAEIGGNVLVGTNKAGYYEMPGGAVADLGIPPNLSFSKLSYAWVIRFCIDTVANPDVAYMLTAQGGLYSNTYDGSAWGADWTHE
ncbi:MAG: hypothetical protein JW969_21415 [Spirochaetales bacterium]|nr:hypothetical protein [Spirochaetales bacterium]